MRDDDDDTGPAWGLMFGRAVTALLVVALASCTGSTPVRTTSAPSASTKPVPLASAFEPTQKGCAQFVVELALAVVNQRISESEIEAAYPPDGGPGRASPLGLVILTTSDGLRAELPTLGEEAAVRKWTRFAFNGFAPFTCDDVDVFRGFLSEREIPTASP